MLIPANIVWRVISNTDVLEPRELGQWTVETASMDSLLERIKEKQDTKGFGAAYEECRVVLPLTTREVGLLFQWAWEDSDSQADPADPLGIFSRTRASTLGLLLEWIDQFRSLWEGFSREDEYWIIEEQE